MNKKQFLFLSSLILVTPLLKAEDEPKVENQFDVAEHLVGAGACAAVDVCAYLCFKNIISSLINCNVPIIEVEVKKSLQMQNKSLFNFVAYSGLANTGMMLSEGISRANGSTKASCFTRYLGSSTGVFLANLLNKNDVGSSVVGGVCGGALEQGLNELGRKVYRSLKGVKRSLCGQNR